MATSLVSTGVQFPDSTIQTTAASPSSSSLLSTVTASGASTVDIAVPNGYSNYQLVGYNIYSNGTYGNINIAYTPDSFSTIKTWWGQLNFGYSTTGYGASTTGSNVNYIFGNQAHAPDIGVYSYYPGFAFSATLYNPKSTTQPKNMHGIMNGWGFWGASYTGWGVTTGSLLSTGTDGNAAINGLRVYLGNSRLIYGTFKLYGVL